jgi:hypothetical protein
MICWAFKYIHNDVAITQPHGLTLKLHSWFGTMLNHSQYNVPVGLGRLGALASAVSVTVESML